MRKEKLNMYKMRKRMLTGMLLLLCINVYSVQTDASKKNTWVKKSGRTYYYNVKGKKATGLKTVGGKYYFFDKKGVLYKKGWKTIRGKKYYFAKKNGAASTGPEKIGKVRYLFSEKGSLSGTGIRKYKGKYYYTKKGVLQTGLKTVKGKIYFFSAKGQAKIGWKKIKGKKYYFGTNGAALTGKRTIDGRTYQFSKKGVLLKELTKKPETSQKPQGPATPGIEGQGTSNRPVEPVVQDPSVIVPTVTPVENTLMNRVNASGRLNGAIFTMETYLSGWTEQDFEPKGYKLVMLVFDEAKKMYQIVSKTSVKDNCPYTATEIYQEAAKLDAYREQCLKLQVKQVLTYYPEQSRAIFDAINEYRVSKGVKPLIWSEDLSKNARLEAGYCAYIYKGTDDEEDLRNFMNHFGGQNGAYKTAGFMGLEECVQGWINSPGHEWLLRDTRITHGSVAYYSYNSATSGGNWSAIIFDTAGKGILDGYQTHAPESVWSILLNCETSNKLIP